MSLDLAIRGGTVIDGTGAPGRPADVGIAGGRIAEISPRLSDTAVRTIDAQGLVVAPGFVDIHTHLDAAVLWDDTLSPSPLHGVTTVIGGNCGFTVAPIVPEARDYLLAMLARVEGMPAESLATGLDWNWGTTAEYLDRTDRPLAANAGFLVGHSAIRRTVMGERSSELATAAEVEAMVELLRAGLTAGGLGFSTSTSNTHHDGNGRPVPSRAASRDEIMALCRAVQGTAATVVEISPGVEGFDLELAELMADMSLAADRPLNWNPVIVDAATEAGGWDRLRMSDAAAERGAEVLALTIPLAITARHCLATPSVLAALPGWEESDGPPPPRAAGTSGAPRAPPGTRPIGPVGEDAPVPPGRLGRLCDRRGVQLAHQAAGGPHRRRCGRRARCEPVGCPVRHRGGRRPANRIGVVGQRGRPS